MSTVAALNSNYEKKHVLLKCYLTKQIELKKTHQMKSDLMILMILVNTLIIALKHQRLTCCIKVYHHFHQVHLSTRNMLQEKILLTIQTK